MVIEKKIKILNPVKAIKERRIESKFSQENLGYNKFSIDDDVEDYLNRLQSIGVYGIVFVIVVLAGSDNKSGVRAITELAYKKLCRAVGSTFGIEEVAADKHVIDSAAADVFHHSDEGRAKPAPALLVLLGRETDVGAVEMNIAAMNDLHTLNPLLFTSFYSLNAFHKSSQNNSFHK